ncbi:MAG TPA: 50S ribosomal protein L13 [Actinomycetota bacterium]|jgi:large subunit ribosomal protein L13|nr:50S ribosomal protein L13 [Actinomycetota bacterium]
MKTYTPKPSDIEHRWWLVDAEGATLGRLASEVASILRGKHKPTWAPHLDSGDHVVIVNAAKVRLSGAKREQKKWYRHSQFPGGLREIPYDRLLRERPDLAVEKAVRGMLPKTRLGRRQIRKLHVYAGPEHSHQGQKPEPLELGRTPGAATTTEES